MKTYINMALHSIAISILGECNKQRVFSDFEKLAPKMISAPPPSREEN